MKTDTTNLDDLSAFTKALSKALRLAEKNSWYWLWPASPDALIEARDRARKQL